MAGNSYYLRGWNKYDIDPIGGNRLVHNSVEYRYGPFQAFYDAGAVWDSGQPATRAPLRRRGLQGIDFFARFSVPGSVRTRRTDRHDRHDLLMETRSREKRISRRSWLLAGLTIPLFSARAADPLKVTYDGDNLHVAAPTLHFLTGKPLERLKYGDVVAYVAQLELLNEARTVLVRPQKGRFVVSYALWEEKFSVTQLGSTWQSRRARWKAFRSPPPKPGASNNLTMSTQGLAAERLLLAAPRTAHRDRARFRRRSQNRHQHSAT